MKKKKKTKNKYNINTFSKIWINRLMWFSIVWISSSFVLAFLGREQIAETLAITITAQIVLLMCTYFCKSFFETKEEKRQDFKIRQWESTQKDYLCGIQNDSRPDDGLEFLDLEEEQEDSKA